MRSSLAKEAKSVVVTVVIAAKIEARAQTERAAVASAVSATESGVSTAEATIARIASAKATGVATSEAAGIAPTPATVSLHSMQSETEWFETRER